MGLASIAWVIAVVVGFAVFLSDQPYWWYPASILMASTFPLPFLWTRFALTAYIVGAVAASVMVAYGLAFGVGLPFLPAAVGLIVTAVLADA